MWNRIVEIDRIHCQAICDEVGERLRTLLSGAELPLRIRRQLRELDRAKSASIVSIPGF
jgi:hypothetical protein